VQQIGKYMTTADTTSAALAYVNTMAFIYRQQMPAFATILLTVAELLLVIKKTKNAQPRSKLYLMNVIKLWHVKVLNNSLLHTLPDGVCSVNVISVVLASKLNGMQQ